MSSLTHAEPRLGTGTANVAISPIGSRSRRTLAAEIAALTGTAPELWFPVDDAEQADPQPAAESAETAARRLERVADVILTLDQTDPVTAATAAGAYRTLLDGNRPREHRAERPADEQELRNARRRAEQAVPAPWETDLAEARRYARRNGVTLDRIGLERLAAKIRARRIAAEIAEEQAEERRRAAEQRGRRPRITIAQLAGSAA
ncbi:hypothetical protein AB0C76_33065 [Kitasatospora sp. NPDC048722]|uniref:hypothetical protein n=1 Tax=Kitasatospora sp. NPDC048722 TaxID=3155639 RepID=UPI0033D0100C